MRKAFAVLALASLLFAGAGLVGCASPGTAVRSDCAFCTKTGMECRMCKPGEPCAQCKECMQCPACTADKACADCMECMRKMAK